MSAKHIPGFYYDEIKKRYFQITKDFKPPTQNKQQQQQQQQTSKIKGNRTTQSNCENKRGRRCECLPLALHNLQLFGTSGRYALSPRCGFLGLSPRRCKQNSLIRGMRYKDNEAKYINTTMPIHCPYNVKVSNSGRSLALHMKPHGSAYLNERLSVYTVHHGTVTSHDDVTNNSDVTNNGDVTDNGPKHPGDVTFKSEMDVNFPGSRISSFAWSPTEERKILFSLVREHLLRPGFFLRSSELALLNENGLLTIKRYNKNVIECVAWNKYPKDNMLVCTGELSGVVKFKNIHMYGNYAQPFVTKSPPQVLEFSNTSPCLFAGCKSGVVYQYDYRSHSPVWFRSSTKGPGYCIDGLRVLDDDNYIITSNWNGDIAKIDVRLRKPVTEYRGHVNNHSKLGFRLDAHEMFVFAVGSDACLRVWDVRTGGLQHCHHIDRPTDDNFRVPVLEYSDSWGGDATKAGLLCTYSGKYHMWPLV